MTDVIIFDNIIDVQQDCWTEMVTLKTQFLLGLLPEKFDGFYKENKDKIGILLNQMFGDNTEVLLSGFEEHTEKIKSVCSRTNNSSRDLLFDFEVVK